MSALSIGSLVWGEQRHVCKVLDIQRSKSGKIRLLVSHPQGQNVVISLERVKGFAISPEPTTETLPKSISIGATVGKRVNLGWLGWVQSEPINGRCEVLWQYDRHPTLEKLTDLKIKEIK
jgi:hypothetical protein